MLSFHITLAATHRTGWRQAAEGWVCGDSHIRPIQHPAVEAAAVAHPDGAMEFCVRERLQRVDVLPGSPSDHDREFQRIVIRPGRVTITAGIYGTCPLYITATASAVSGSWDLSTFAGQCRLDQAHPVAVTRIVTRNWRYTSQTPFPHIQQLTERASAMFDGTGLRLAYPEPAEHVIAGRQLRDGVDAIDSFGRLLEHVVGTRLDTSVSVELSGGLDSANVALTVGRLARQRGLSAIGLALGMPGSSGAQQYRRQRWLAQLSELQPTFVPGEDYLPFSAAGPRTPNMPHDPSGGSYTEAFTALANQSAGSAATTVFTGIGGDELLALPSTTPHSAPASGSSLVPWLGPVARESLSELEDHTAPVSVIPFPTLMAFAVRNPTYLRAGVWPVSPLADPLLIRFGESLPLHWRRGKRIMRQRLMRTGAPTWVTHREVPEHFLDLLRLGLVRNVRTWWHQLYIAPVLADLRYIDIRRWREALIDLTERGKFADAICDTISAELGLRSMCSSAADSIY